MSQFIPWHTAVLHMKHTAQPPTVNSSPGPGTAKRGKGGRRKNTGFILLSTHLGDY